MKCLVVGAGMSGLTAARLLQSAGWKVTVLDKGRGVGGRMATRRLGDSRLDHGAQFFTVRHPLFANAVQDWRTRGLVEPWFTHDQHVRYRAAHGMNALAKELAADLDVRTSQTVTRLHSRQGWAVETESGAIYEADLLLMTAPAPQLIPLLKDLNPSFAESLRGIAFDPCLALLVTGDGRSLVPAPGFARPADGPVAWVADNRQKGLPGDAVALTLHATPEFSREYLERPAEAEPLLRQAAAAWLDGQPRDVQFHRWRYSIPTRTLPHRFLSTTQPAPLIVAGDAFGGPRVEGAFLSGWAAAEEAL